MILILGGTTEGRLAANTLDESGSPFYYSTRGDEQEVSLHHGIRLQGGMDAEAMELFCRQKGGTASQRSYSGATSANPCNQT